MNEINITVEKYPDDPDLLIPAGIAVRCGGDYDISCYEDTADIVCDYAERYGNDLFGNEAAEYLRSRLDPIFAERGYALQLEVDLVYHLDRKLDECTDVTVINARDALELDNLCGIDLDEAVGIGQEAFVCVEDGCVVSVAVENYTHKGETEIAVETAPDHRRRGYARAAATVLCNDIVASGGRVTWHCSEDNAPSVALAESIGFKLDGREMYYCYFKLDDRT